MIMDIDATIEKYKEKAKFYKETTNVAYGLELEQIAEWLDELVDYRRFNGAKTFDNGFKQGEKYGYNKAIDDLASELENHSVMGDIGKGNETLFEFVSPISRITKVAEQMKK